MIQNPILAIIVPCFNEEDVIKKSYFEISDVLQKLIKEKNLSDKSYICFVDDGSSDKTWEIISKISKYNDVKGIKLSKNFGHQYALVAGLSDNEADIFITLDADLQDDVSVIPDMIKKYNEGAEIVYGIRENRKNDSFLKRLTAEYYYKTLSFFGAKTIFNHADYRLISKKIANILKDYKESNLYLRGLISSLGFKSDFVFYTRGKRVAGEAKYNIIKSSKLAIDGITAFSVKPLHFITCLGFFCFFVAILMSIYSIFVYAQNKIIPGWTSLFLSIYFLGGIQLISIGILGEYIGRIYVETKQRPKYIIEEKVG